MKYCPQDRESNDAPTAQHAREPHNYAASTLSKVIIVVLQVRGLEVVSLQLNSDALL